MSSADFRVLTGCPSALSTDDVILSPEPVTRLLRTSAICFWGLPGIAANPSAYCWSCGRSAGSASGPIEFRRAAASSIVIPSAARAFEMSPSAPRAALFDLLEIALAILFATEFAPEAIEGPSTPKPKPTPAPPAVLFKSPSDLAAASAAPITPPEAPDAKLFARRPPLPAPNAAGAAATAGTTPATAPAT